MEKIGLIAALRRTIMKDVAVTQFTKEYKALGDKDKVDLVKTFNKEKTFGDNVEVVIRTI